MQRSKFLDRKTHIHQAGAIFQTFFSQAFFAGHLLDMTWSNFDNSRHSLIKIDCSLHLLEPICPTKALPKWENIFAYKFSFKKKTQSSNLPIIPFWGLLLPVVLACGVLKILGLAWKSFVFHVRLTICLIQMFFWCRRLVSIKAKPNTFKNNMQSKISNMNKQPTKISLLSCRWALLSLQTVA